MIDLNDPKALEAARREYMAQQHAERNRLRYQQIIDDCMEAQGCGFRPKSELELLVEAQDRRWRRRTLRDDLSQHRRTTEVRR